MKTKQQMSKDELLDEEKRIEEFRKKMDEAEDTYTETKDTKMADEWPN